jgi:hypothetical protein
MRRFSLRDVFGMTLVVALAIGWWQDHKSIREQFVKMNRERNEWQIFAQQIQRDYDEMEELLSKHEPDYAARRQEMKRGRVQLPVGGP